MQRLAITWLGHSTFLVRTPGGVKVLFDPWLAANPSCPDACRRPPAADLILVSHGHGDHIGDLVVCARNSHATVVAGQELCDWLDRRGITRLEPMNIGGSQQLLGLTITMTDARHSGGYAEEGRGEPLGPAAGYVLRLEDGMSLYFAGDTGLFGDMKLIGELYQPQIAFLPIGDRFTMGPREAAKAAQLLGVRQVVPMHWGTFPQLTGTPEALKACLGTCGVDVLELKPGETAE